MAMFDPILTPIQSNPFIAPAVQDKSMETLVKGLANIGVEAYTGYQQASVSQDIEKEVVGFLDRNDAYEEASNKMAEAQGLAKGADELLARGGNIADAKILEAQHMSILDKYRGAYDQGRMSTDELSARILKTTREAINRNPWLAQELTQAANRYMESSGASSIISTAANREKMELEMAKKQMEDENAVMKEMGITLRDFGGDRNAAVGYAFEQKRIWQKAKQQSDIIDMALKQRKLSQEMATQTVMNPQFAVSSSALLDQTTRTVMNNMASGAYGNTNEAQIAISQAFDELETTVTGLEMLVPPDQRAPLSNIRANIEKRKELLAKIQAGGVAAEAAKNEMDVLKAMSEKPYISANTQLDIAGKLSSVAKNVSDARMMFPDKATQERLTTIITNMSQGAMGTLGSLNFSAPQDKQVASIIFTPINPEVDGRGKDVAVTQNAQWLSTTIKDIKAISDPRKSSQAINEFYNSILKESQRSGKKLSEYYPRESLSEFDSFTGEVLRNITNVGKLEYDEGRDEFHVITSDPNVAKVASENANRMFKAVMSVHGYDNPDKAAEFLLQFLTGPVGATTPIDVSKESALAATLRARGMSDAEIIPILAETFGGKAEVTAPVKTITPAQVKPAITPKKEEESVLDKLKGVQQVKEWIDSSPKKTDLGVGPSRAKPQEAPSKPATAPQKPKPIPTPSQAPKASQNAPMKAEERPLQKSTPLSSYVRGEKYYLKEFKKTTGNGGTYVIVDSKGKEHYITNKSTYDAFVNKFEVKPTDLPKWSGK